MDQISDFGKRITYESKEEFDPYMDANPQRSSSLCFASLCMWGEQYYKIIDGFLCIVGSDWVGLEFPDAYMCTPLSIDGNYEPGKLRDVIFAVKKEICPNAEPVMILGVTGDQLYIYNQALKGIAEPRENQASWDYIYQRSDLEHLVGRKYTVKRNHLNHLKAQWKYHYEPITPACLEELEEALDDFLERKLDQGDSDVLLKAEVDAVKKILPIYDKLGMFGGFIRLDGKIKAFAMGSMINPEMVDVAVEKADPTVRGLYQAINREFVKALPPEVLYINREEDMGVKGLRQAKRSYHPCCMIKVYTYRF